MRLSPQLLAFNRANQKQSLTLPALDGAQIMNIRQNPDPTLHPEGSSDGRGGMTDSLVTPNDEYTPGPIVGYDLQVKPKNRGERLEGDRVTEETIYQLYMPWNVVIDLRDQILLINSGRTFEVLELSDVTNRSTMMVTVKEQK